MRPLLLGQVRAEEALKRHYASGASPLLATRIRKRLRNLRILASMGRFHRNLRALPPHYRYIGDRARFWTPHEGLRLPTTRCFVPKSISNRIDGHARQDRPADY